MVETKKLWHIVGPSIFTRITTYLTLIITQAFACHLGELELAAISIVNNVVIMGFNFGFLGIWAGMIFGGTAIQTLILIFIVTRCDWDKEVMQFYY
ncbi:unnamed protein product, partial [Brassica rapa]